MDHLTKLVMSLNEKHVQQTARAIYGMEKWRRRSQRECATPDMVLLMDHLGHESLDSLP